MHMSIGEASLLDNSARCHFDNPRGAFVRLCGVQTFLVVESCFIHRVKNGFAGVGRKDAIWLRLAIIFLMDSYGWSKVWSLRCNSARETLAP